MENSTEVVSIEREVRQETNSIIEKLANMEITDKVSCEGAIHMGKTINGLKKKINDYSGLMVKAAHESHKAVKAKQNEATKPLDEAKAVLANKITTYSQSLITNKGKDEEKIKGVTENWQFRVTDKVALIKAVLKGSVIDEAIIINDKWLSKMAKLYKDKETVPGIEFYNKGSVRF